MGLAVIAAACGEDDRAAAELDLATLEAETEVGTLKAQRVDDSYTARLGEHRAIGVAYLDDLGVEASADQIAVQLYDGTDKVVMTGEVDPQGAATLSSGELSDFDASVELTIDDDTVTGTVAFPDESVAFTADAATGDAGAYWAQGTEENPDVTGDWVVLSDGSQWGCVCPPPFNSPCCMLRQ